MTSKLEQRARDIAESSGFRCFESQYHGCGVCMGCAKAQKLAGEIVKLTREFAGKALREARHKVSMSYWVRLDPTDIRIALQSAEEEVKE